MTIRTILVPLFGTDGDKTALTAAVAVARRFEAHVEALFVAADPKDSVLVLGDGMSTLMLDEILRAAEATRETRLTVARTHYQAAAVGLPEATRPVSSGGVTIRWRDCVGRVDPVIAAEGRLFDLVVIAGAESGSLARPTTAITDAYDAALLSTGRPVLVARPAGPMTPGRVIAIAWSGTLEASRAVAAAAPWFAQAERVHILTVGTSDMARLGERLAGSLVWRGVEAKISLIEPGNDSIGVAILRRAAEVESDLLVMGAYGRNRMREMIWGGVTRHVLTHPGPMVLMAH